MHQAHLQRVALEVSFPILVSKLLVLWQEKKGRRREKNMTIGSHVLVLDFSMLSIQNLFTRNNWGILFASHIIQNPLLLKGSLLPKLCLSRPRDLLSAPSVALPLTASYPSGRDSLLPGGLYLCICSSLSEAWGRVSKQH